MLLHNPPIKSLGIGIFVSLAYSFSCFRAGITLVYSDNFAQVMEQTHEGL